MIRSYVKIAWRNLWKSKLFSFVNIFGLAIGLAAFWLIILYIGYEFSFDRFHAKADRIYRVAQHASWSDGNLDLAPTSSPFAQALKDDYPEIEETVRINPEGGGIITHNENTIIVDEAYFVDNSIFKVFTFEFIAGDPATALASPQSIVLTEALANKLFRATDEALGKTVFFENNFPNKVTGVVKDIPSNTHLRFSALRSLPENYTSGWQNFNLYTYVLLHEHADINQLRDKIPGFFSKYLKKEMGNVDYQMEFQPLTSIHLYSDLDYDLGANGNANNIYIFLAAAILIIIVAAINYMNLSAIRSSIRVREIGIRKVIGAGKSQLISLFLLEAILVSFIAMILALFLCELLLPFVKALSGIELSLWQFGIWNTIFAAFLIFGLVGVICGIYPAFFLSNFKTTAALKGQIGNISANITIRKSLVILQFVIAIVMISGSWTIYNQLKYVLQKDLGFNKDQVLTFHLSSQEAREKVAVLKQRLLQNPAVTGVAAASNPIGNNNIGANGFYLEQEDGQMSTSTKMIQRFSADEDFIETLEVGLLAGRNFSQDHTSGAYEAVLVNEALVKDAGWEQPIGKRIRFDIPGGQTAEVEVVGVINDFHIYSLQHEIAPLIIHRILPEDQDNIYVRLQPDGMKEAIAFVEETYAAIDPVTLDLHFLDQNFAQQYQSEQQQGNLLLVFTGLAVFLALLGLFGLTAFSAEKRSKEIGIRKVLGASIPNLIALLSKDFLKLVLIAFVIAVPVAWFLLGKWLQYFAYHVEIKWWVFAITALAVLVVSWATISYQSIKTALTNPVDSLKED